MGMKIVNCEIKGTSPLLMHRFPMIQIEGLEKKSKEEQAEISAYRDMENDELYVPGEAIYRMLINAAIYSKGKGRASLQKVVAACIMIEPEICSLGTKKYTIDTRSAVNPMTKGRIIVNRPRLNDWKVSFQISYDDVLLTEQQVRKVVDDAGTRVGLLDYRPEKKGPFGRFMVTNWNNK